MYIPNILYGVYIYIYIHMIKGTPTLEDHEMLKAKQPCRWKARWGSGGFACEPTCCWRHGQVARVPHVHWIGLGDFFYRKPLTYWTLRFSSFVYPSNMMIFHSYVNLPEGNDNKIMVSGEDFPNKAIHWHPTQSHPPFIFTAFMINGPTCPQKNGKGICWLLSFLCCCSMFLPYLWCFMWWRCVLGQNRPILDHSCPFGWLNID